MQRSIFLLALVLAYPSACAKKSSSSSSAAKDPPAGGGEEIPSPEGDGENTTPNLGTNTEPEGNPPPIGPGKLALDLGKLTALGVGSQAQGGGQRERGLLVRVEGDGTTTAERLAITPGTIALDTSLSLTTTQDPTALPVQISTVLAAAGYGVVLRGTMQKDGVTIGAFDGSDIALADEAGVLHAILPADGEPQLLPSASFDFNPAELQAPEPRYVYAKNGARVWRYDLQEKRAKVAATAPDGETLLSFGAAAGGHVVMKTNIFSPHQDKIYWVKPSGTMVALNADNYDMGYPYSLPAGIVASTTIFRPSGDGLDAIRSGYVKFGTNASAWSVPTGRAGSWSTSPVYAIDYTNLAIAQNPFLLIERSQGYAGSSQNQLLIDAANRLAFDGNNIVQLDATSDGFVEVKHHRNIATDATKNDVVVAVYGPQQGFSDDWGALVHRRIDGSTGTYAFGFLDPATGKLKEGEIYDFDNVVNGYSFDMTTIYKVDTDYVLIGSSDINAGVRQLTLETSSGTKKAKWGAKLGDVWTYTHRYAAVHDSALYFTAAGATGLSDKRRVLVYEESSSDVSETHITPAGLAGLADFKCDAAANFPFLGIVPLLNAGPAIVARPCGAPGDAGNLLLLVYSDWTFSNLVNAVSLPVLESEVDFTTVSPSNTLFIAPLASDKLAFGIAKTSKVAIVTFGSSDVIRSMSQIKVQGRMEFASLFEGSQIFGEYYTTLGIDAKTSNIIPWGSEHLLVTVRADPPVFRRSYRIVIGTRAMSELNEMRGYSITSGTTLPSGSLLLSGYKITDADTSSATPAAVLLQLTTGGAVNQASEQVRIETLAPLGATAK